MNNLFDDKAMRAATGAVEAGRKYAVSIPGAKYLFVAPADEAYDVLTAAIAALDHDLILKQMNAAKCTKCKGTGYHKGTVFALDVVVSVPRTRTAFAPLDYCDFRVYLHKKSHEIWLSNCRSYCFCSRNL